MKHALWRIQHHSRPHEQRSESYSSSSACSGGNITPSLERSSADGKADTVSVTWEALVVWEVGTAFEVTQ